MENHQKPYFGAKKSLKSLVHLLCIDRAVCDHISLIKSMIDYYAFALFRYLFERLSGDSTRQREKKIHHRRVRFDRWVLETSRLTNGYWRHSGC